MQFLWVFIGGGLGSICRYGISRLLDSQGFLFPLATLIANALSCIVLGLFVSWGLKNLLDQPMKLLVMTGFCGGFSTFSTFTNETYQLLNAGHHWYAISNIGLSLIICLTCIGIGIKLGEVF